MRALAMVPLMVALACLVAGVFGMVHNQVSFTLGPSYFYDLKFAQFGVDGQEAPRLGAAIVGWRASWWMGAFLGLPMALAALRHDAPLRAFAIGVAWAIGVTTLCAALGIAAGYWLGEDRIADLLRRPRQGPGFYIAGMIHDASYMGGPLGLVVALFATWRRASPPKAAEL